MFNNYVISYDVAAMIIMIMFCIYYLTRKRFVTIRNKRFNVLVILVMLSIAFDILGTVTLHYSHELPVFVNYFTNSTYFVVTGLMSVAFCVYTLYETKSLIKKSAKITHYILFFVPSSLLILCIITSPFTHLVYYLDENKDYQHGPFMNGMLIIVILYLLYSTIRISINSKAITLKKRMPLYAFIIFMFISICLQWLTTKYLLYGFAEAMGIIVIYLANHNPTEIIDSRNDVFNRKALLMNLQEKISDSQRCCVTSIGIEDVSNVLGDKKLEDDEEILKSLTEFYKSHFDENNLYFLEGNDFAIVTETDLVTCGETEHIIRKRFEKPWRIGNRDITFKYGISQIHFPDDVKKPTQLIEYLETGIGISIEKKAELITVNKIVDEREKLIYNLENRQKVLEEQYRESENKMQKALNADKSKSMFLAQMSHEIRTPMTAILGMTQLLIRDSQDPKTLDYANAIMNSGKTLIGIINDILDFSKIEAGKLEIISDNYYITSTVYDIINNIEQRISDKRLEFNVYVDPKIPATLYGDELRIKQIINNLLTNACKYTEIGSVNLDITWESKSEEIGLLRVKVADTGIGIKEENLSKIFNGFERFDAQRNKAIEGTGLGLAICRQLIDGMHGTIKAESVYEKGSTFTVCIPQKIVNPAASISIDIEPGSNILAFCGKDTEIDQYKKSFADFNVNVDCVRASESIDRMLKSKDYSYIFINYKEYEKRMADSDPLIKDSRVVVALYYRHFFANIKWHRVIHFPICSVNLASMVMNEISQSDSKEISTVEYIAPDAKLLVVDDNIVNLRIFSGLLEKHGMKIEMADSGNVAIEKSQTEKYDIIFLDHMMPKKDGVETLKEMRADKDNINAGTPVVAFTANAVSGMKEMFLENGFVDFLSKPIDIIKMEDIILKFLPEDKVTRLSPEEALSIKEKLKEEGSDNSSDVFTVEGLDMEKALYYAGGSYKTLKSFLKVFVDDGENKKKLISDYVEQEDYNDYRVEIHAVKSLTKGIGADALSELAKSLETAAKEGNYEYIKSNYKKAVDDYSELIENVKAAISEDKSAKAEVQRADYGMELTEQLTCVLALLHDFEEELARKLFDNIETASLGDELKQKLDEIDKKLSLFDFEGAAEIITEVVNEN